MLTFSEAWTRAQAHIEANPLWDGDYRYFIQDSFELPEGWFFFYHYEHVGDLPKERWTEFLGAVGFVVAAVDGSIRESALLPPQPPGPRSDLDFAGPPDTQRRRWIVTLHLTAAVSFVICAVSVVAQLRGWGTPLIAGQQSGALDRKVQPHSFVIYGISFGHQYVTFAGIFVVSAILPYLWICLMTIYLYLLILSRRRKPAAS